MATEPRTMGFSETPQEAARRLATALIAAREEMADLRARAELAELSNYGASELEAIAVLRVRLQVASRDREAMADTLTQAHAVLLEATAELDAGTGTLDMLARLVDEHDARRQHSILLHTVARKLAIALGDAPVATAVVDVDPVELTDRVIGALASTRRALNDHVCGVLAAAEPVNISPSPYAP